MAAKLENLGLDFCLDDEETFEKFIGYCINKLYRNATKPCREVIFNLFGRAFQFACV